MTTQLQGAGASRRLEPEMTIAPRPGLEPGPRAAVEGERKVVTVLFCDVVDSTGLAERLGPEGMHGLLSRFFELSLGEVNRYEGTINQFLGDGFMALFGAPVAREDHARRAVLAALAVQRALRERAGELGLPDGSAFAVRIGVNTGPVVVGTIGDNLRMDYTAVGDTTNVAGRLEQLAEPDVVLIGEATARLVQGYIRLAPVGLLRVKGKAEPIAAYRVMGPGRRRSRLRGDGEHRLTPFVGREDELARLRQLFARVEAGEGQAVGVVGEPGVGKSRLLLEFRRRLAGRAATWLEGHCLSYGQAMPHLPLLDVVRQSCGIREGDGREAATAKAHARLVDLGLDPAEGLPWLLHLLGVEDGPAGVDPVSPESARGRAFDLLHRMMLAASRRRPLVLVVEDMHWADAASEEYAASLVERLREARVLVVLTYRPGYRPRALARPSATEIAVGELSPRDSLAILRAVRGAVAEPVASAILERASGNPLFLEELGRAAGEPPAAAGPVPVPDTIQDVLAARIDRLPATARRLLQTASVLGREVSLRLLDALWADPASLPGALAELSGLGLLIEQAPDPEPVYVFSHGLLQEVAYASLLERRRRTLHLEAARALERLHAGRLHAVVELLAHHYGRTDDERAVDYALLAADKAQRRWANAEALAAFDLALGRLGALPDSPGNRGRRIDVVIRQAEIRLALGQDPEQMRALESIRGLVEICDDPGRQAAWHYWTGFLCAITGGPLASALDACRQAAAIADGAGLAEARARAECCAAQVHLLAGDLRAALASAEAALAAFEASGSLWWACRAVWQISPAANALGQWQRSLSSCRRALRHGHAVDDRRVKIVAWTRMGGTHVLRGELDAALRCSAEALALSPGPFDSAMARGVRGAARLRAGDLSAGLGELEEAVAWFDRSRLRYVRSQYALWLCEGLLDVGERARARAILAEVRATCRDLGYRYLGGVAERLLGECAAPGDPAAARAHLRQARDLLGHIGARNELAKVVRAEAALCAADGDTVGARMLYASALRIFIGLGTLDEPPRVRAALARL